MTSGLRAIGRAAFFLGKGEIVETAHLVGTVVGAEAGADAAVVDHDVQAFLVVHGGTDGADDLARRPLAVLAQDRLQQHVRCLRAAFVVAIDAQPVHLALMDHLLLADDGDVVFRHAGDDAGVAADAGIQVDAHAPGGGAGGFSVVLLRLGLRFAEEGRIGVESGEGAVMDVVAGVSKDRVVMFGGRQHIVAIRLVQRHRAASCGQRIDIKADPLTHHPHVGAAEAQQRDDTVGCLPRHDPRRQRHPSSAVRYGHAIAVHQPQPSRR